MSTHPALAHPPAALCHPCQDVWAAWGGVDLTVTQLDGGGEGRRRQVIAQQRENVAARCRQAGHDRDRTAPAPTEQVGVPVQPANFHGARIKALLDDFEGLLPADGRTREQRLAAAVQQVRADHAAYQRTRQPYQPTQARKEAA